MLQLLHRFKNNNLFVFDLHFFVAFSFIGINEQNLGVH